MNDCILVKIDLMPTLALSSRSPANKRIPTRKELIMMRVNHREKELENHDRGLNYDLPRLLHRRGMLKLVARAGFAGAGLITLGACADSASTADANAPLGGRQPRGGASEDTGTSDTANGEIPEETSGPYPGDGSNGANVPHRKRHRTPRYNLELRI
jgi:hypothetical protein